MKYFMRLTAALYCSSLLISCSSGSSSPAPSSSSASSSNSSSTSSTSSSGTAINLETIEYKSGGDASTSQWDENAFSQSPPLINSNFKLDGAFKRGNILFRATASGRGPLLNSAVCQGCHIKDGRGHPPSEVDQPLTSMLLKASLGNDSNGNTIPDPIYGTQLQTFAIDTETSEVFKEAEYGAALDETTITGEVKIAIKYDEIAGTYPSGQTYSLRKPTYILSQPAFGELANGLKISPRIAPPMIGLGLLDAIPDESLLVLADEQDTNSDGISGKLKYVLDPTTNTQEIARYGWKLSTASVLQQTAGALMNDMGVSNQFVPEEPCSELQIACTKKAEAEEHNGNNMDISTLSLASIELYSRLLAVPERRGYNKQSQEWEPAISAGKTLFSDIHCDSCHTPYFKTGDAFHSVLGRVVLTELVEDNSTIDVLSQQHIWPYSDLLLHDMGGECSSIARETADHTECSSGEECLWVQRCDGLADGREDGTATGSEWRTPPLWGIGLTHTVDPNARFLHDGRARTIEEAILWHGGEASDSAELFKNLSETDREHLLEFLNSL